MRKAFLKVSFVQKFIMNSQRIIFNFLFIIFIKTSQSGTRQPIKNNSSNKIRTITCKPIDFKEFDGGDAMRVKFSYDQLTQTIKATISCKSGYDLNVNQIRVKFRSTYCINGTWYHTTKPFCGKNIIF